MASRTLSGVILLVILAGAGIAFAHRSGSSEAPATIEEESVAEAQQRLDPTNDPATVLQRAPSGEWIAFDVLTAKPVPESVRTVSDLAEQIARDEVAAGVISDVEASARAQAIVDQYECLAGAMREPMDGEEMPGGLRAATSTCAE